MNPISLPPDTPGGLEQLLAGELWPRLLDEGRVFPLDDPASHIRYLRLKPGSCRIFLLGEERQGADEPPQGILLRIYDDKERARTAFEKEKTRRPLPSPDGLMSFYDESSGVVGLPFPNDPEIPELRRIYEPDRFRRLALGFLPDQSGGRWRLQRSLTKFRLLAYKPGRRAVLKAKLKFRHLDQDLKERIRLHLKVEKKQSAGQSIRQAREISKATAQCKLFRTPRFLGAASNGSLYAHQWSSGSRIDLSSEDLPRILEGIGSAIAEFHALPLELRPLSPPQLMIDEVNIIRSDLSRLVPQHETEIGDTCDALISVLPDLSLQPSSLLHGDLHLNQILIERDRPLLVDFDRAGRGYSCLDIGSFLEDLHSRGVTREAQAAFEDGYSCGSGNPVASDHVMIGRGMALLRRACEPLRELDPDWRSKLLASVETCQRYLEGDHR
ncbi:MAG: hypothetical protein COB10_03185 [Planctomycetota bacterium]|nr:MAG: hypothetical protein COB10_03185 [Planctomycetota bacterium]